MNSFNEPVKIKSKADLKLGQHYQVYDNAWDEYAPNCEYLGFNELNNKYAFKHMIGEGDKCIIFMVNNKNIIDDVCFNF